MYETAGQHSSSDTVGDEVRDDKSRLCHPAWPLCAFELGLDAEPIVCTLQSRRDRSQRRPTPVIHYVPERAVIDGGRPPHADAKCATSTSELNGALELPYPPRLMSGLCCHLGHARAPRACSMCPHYCCAAHGVDVARAWVCGHCIWGGAQARFECGCAEHAPRSSRPNS